MVLFSTLPSVAATFVVNNNGDTVDAIPRDGICSDSFGNCTLRAAIQTANEQPDADTINFSLPVPNTILVTEGTLVITTNVSITGPDATQLVIKRSSNSVVESSVFSVSSTATLNQMTIANGNFSGVRNSGTLTLNKVIIRDNFGVYGGGIYNTGTLNVSDSTITNNGSGGTAQPFNPNAGLVGGGSGIWIEAGKATINRTTISNNSIGVGRDERFGSAGIAVNGGEVSIFNSTISGNTVVNGGKEALICLGSTVNLINVTITGNSGGVGINLGSFGQTNSIVKIRNTIIANNKDAVDTKGAFISLGNNIIGNPGTATGFINNIKGDKVGVNPLLAPLANNGGLTLTHAFLPNSPAVNAGNNCVVTATCSSDNPPQPLTADQRGTGFSRQIGSFVDIGAFETSTFLTLANNTLEGRVLSPEGLRISKALVALTTPNGEIRYAFVNPFGFFRFNNLASGSSYTLNIRHKRYTFAAQSFSN